MHLIQILEMCQKILNLFHISKHSRKKILWKVEIIQLSHQKNLFQEQKQVEWYIEHSLDEIFNFHLLKTPS